MTSQSQLTSDFSGRRMFTGAAAASLTVAMGSFVQGWDTSATAGSLLYLTPRFHLDEHPVLHGAVVSINLICAVIGAGVSGPASDFLGRRILLTIAALSSLTGAFVMAFTDSIYQVLGGRALTGISKGILVSMAPTYITEISPASTRGQLSTLPQLMRSFGFLSGYVMDFLFSLGDGPNCWKYMLGATIVPSVTFLFCMMACVPESPRWLLEKGRIAEAKKVLQWLRCSQDVSEELRLQMEGVNACLPGEDEFKSANIRFAHVALHGDESSPPTAATFKRGGRSVQNGDMSPSASGEVEEESECESEDEALVIAKRVYQAEAIEGRRETLRGGMSSLEEPLLGGVGEVKRVVHCGRCTGENWSSVTSGWGQFDDLDKSERAQSSREVDRGGARSSSTSSSSTLLSQPRGGRRWTVLMEPGLQKALVIGIGLQLFQQATGICIILGFSPLIFQRSGKNHLQSMAVSSESTSIFYAGCACMLMIPAIMVAMRLMDTKGRRYLLLWTSPVLAFSMTTLALVSGLMYPGRTRMFISVAAVALFTTTFVMGCGPIPGMLSSEIFPTRARGTCMGICIVAQWSAAFIASQTFPTMLTVMGEWAVFATYALLTCMGWYFVYKCVPETKGRTLEDIRRFFSEPRDINEPLV